MLKGYYDNEDMEGIIAEQTVDCCFESQVI